MPGLHDAEVFITDATKALLPDDENWCHECTLGVCKICGEPLSEDDHFHIYKEVGDETWCIDLHYACGVLSQYVEEFRERSIDAWIPPH